MARQTLSSMFRWGLLFLTAMEIYGFYQTIDVKSTQASLARSRPLRTANNGFYGLIPRLEPGLRLTKPLFDTSEAPTIRVVSLEWLAGCQNPAAEFSVPESKSGLNINLGRFIADAASLIARFSAELLGYFRRVAAASMLIASSLGVPNFRRISIAANSAIAAVAAAPRIAYASTIKKYKDLTPTQKLATTPLYFVGNARGNAYLQEDVQSGNPNQRIIVYFMSSEDANDYLNEMAQVNSQNANEFRITTVSMEKIVDQIQARKQSRKMGRYEMDTIYRIQPSSRQCENADRVVGEGKAEAGRKINTQNGLSIPMFTAPGLAIKRANNEIVTPYYFAYEDLVEDIQKLASTSSTSSSSTSISTSISTSKNGKKKSELPKVVVRDFTEVMCLSKGISKEYLSAVNDVVREADSSSLSASGGKERVATKDIKKALLTTGIVPPRREIEMVKRFYRNQTGLKNEYSRSKLIGAPR